MRKARSISCKESVVKHFHFQHVAWFNRLPELIRTKALKPECSDIDAIKASKYGFEILYVSTQLLKIMKTDFPSEKSLPVNLTITKINFDVTNSLKGLCG